MVDLGLKLAFKPLNITTPLDRSNPPHKVPPIRLHTSPANKINDRYQYSTLNGNMNSSRMQPPGSGLATPSYLQAPRGSGGPGGSPTNGGDTSRRFSLPPQQSVRGGGSDATASTIGGCGAKTPQLFSTRRVTDKNGLEVAKSVISDAPSFAFGFQTPMEQTRRLQMKPRATDNHEPLLSPSQMASVRLRKDALGIDGYVLPCTSALDKPFQAKIYPGQR